MSGWVARQLDLLRAQWPSLVYREEGHWVLLPGWALPPGWTTGHVDIACQIPPTREQAPYAFYVSATDLTFDRTPPGNYVSPSAAVPFEGMWSVFSWAPETWAPTAEPAHGPNMLSFARSFTDRFAEGA